MASNDDAARAFALLEEAAYVENNRIREAEAQYQEYLENIRRQPRGQGGVRANPHDLTTKEATPTSSLASEIANVRSRILNFMNASDSTDSVVPGKLVERIQRLEQEKETLQKTVDQMASDMQAMHKKINLLDIKVSLLDLEKKESEKPTIKTVNSVIKNGTVDDDDNDVDLFGSDEETEEDRRIKEERLKAYETKKAKKTQVVAKSSVVLDVKPWSDETDLKEMEVNVRKIESVGLKWGAGKLVPLAYGIKKLQIVAIVEDDNCSIDWLQEQIEAIDDLVQSVDIAAFNKL